MSKLNQSHRLALKYLESKRPGFVSAEEIGREVGDQIGMDGWGSAFGLPLCTKLVDVGLAVQNAAGHYAAAAKPAGRLNFSERAKIAFTITAVFCIPLLFEHGPTAQWQSLVALIGMAVGPGVMVIHILWEERRDRLQPDRT
jgi:hypothetical protein